MLRKHIELTLLADDTNTNMLTIRRQHVFEDTVMKMKGKKYIQSEKEMDANYRDYVETLSDVLTRCPRATLHISSIPPRTGKLTSKVNKQIALFNAKLRDLAEEEPNVNYINNDIHLTDGCETLGHLYKENDPSHIHLRPEGKERLSANFHSCLKESVYREKLEEEWRLPESLHADG